MKSLLPLLWAGCFSIALWGQSESPYKLSLEKELVFLGTGATVSFIGFNLKAKTPDVLLSDLKLGVINGLDRLAIPYQVDKADKWSDLSLYTSVALPVLFTLGKKSRNDFGKITILFAETMLINQGLTDIIKSTTLRPRPYLSNKSLDPSTPLVGNDRFSFLSGHTSGSAAAAIFFGRVFSDYYPDSQLKPYVWGLAIGLPAVTGYLRVKAGRHYPTDVIAGYLLGAGIGYLVPVLHKIPKHNKNLTVFPTVSGCYVVFSF